MTIKKSYAKLIDLYLWLTLGLFVVGGIRLPNGQLKLTYPKDLLVIGAALIVVGRLLLNVSPKNLSLFRTLDKGFSTLPFFNAEISWKSWTLTPSGTFCATLIFWFAACFCYFPMVRHQVMGTGYWDMAVLENVIYNGSRSGVFFTHLLTTANHEPLHFFPNNRLDLWLYPLALIYRLISKTELLLFLQAFAFLMGVIPFVKLAREILPKNIPAWFVAVFYFSFDAFHRINFWDFHEAAFVVVFGLWAVYFIEKKRVGPAVFFMFCAATWREDAWLGFAAQSLLLGYRTRNWKLSIPLFLLGIGMLPYYAANFNQVNHVNDRYSYLGPSLKGAIPLILGNPLLILTPFKKAQNISFLLNLVYRGGFGSILFAGIPFLFIWIPLSEMVLSDQNTMPNWSNHYVAIAIPLLLYCTLIGWKNLQNWVDRKFAARRFPMIPVLLALSLTQLSFLEPAWIRKLWDGDTAQIACLRSIVKVVPDNAAVITENPLVAQLARRPRIASIEFPTDYENFDLIIMTEPKATPLLASLNEKKPGTWAVKETRCGFVIAQKTSLNP